MRYQCILSTLQQGIHKRLSQEAKELVKRYGSWFIWFPKFTYIRVQGFSSSPYRLPRFPIDKMILLEVTRQLSTYDKIQKKKRKAEIAFLVTLGNSIETCPSHQAVKLSEEELQFYSLVTYASRSNFDTYHKIRRAFGRKYGHKVHLKYYWAIMLWMTLKSRREYVIGFQCRWLEFVSYSLFQIKLRMMGIVFNAEKRDSPGLA